MSQTIKNVIIIGAGGNLGPAILSALDADSYFTVSILARKSSKSTFPEHIKVHTVDDSYPESELVEAFKGQDAIVTTISPTGNASEINVINAAVKAGVKRYMPSEFGSDTRNPRALELLPMFKGKNDVVAYLQSQESKGLSWSALTPGPFFDWGVKTGFLGFDLSSHKATIFGTGDSKISTSNLSTVGAAVAAILRNPEKTANQYVYIASFTTTENEVLAALEKATDQKWEVEYESLEGTIKIGQEKLSRQDYSGIMDLLRGAMFDENKGSNFAAEKQLANDLLGLPKETLAETITKLVKG